jgi:hypothetical protein
MPTVNFFIQDNDHKIRLNKRTLDIKSYIARELTCGNIQLSSSEISIRFIDSKGSGMLGDVEVEMTAHAFDERVKKQDEICLNVRDYLSELLPDANIRAWLLLPQLGHSWEQTGSNFT